MPLPELPAFEEFLAGSSIVAVEPVSGNFELVQKSSDGVNVLGYQVWLTWPSGALQLDSVLKKVGEELQAQGALSSRALALATLTLIVGTRGTGGHVEHANRLLREVRQAQLWFNFVSPTPPTITDVRADYGTIKVEPFDPTSLEYWAGRSDAHWPIEPKELRGRIALVSRLERITIINTARLPGADRFSNNWSGDGAILIDAYFQSVADALMSQLMTGLLHV